MDLRGKIMTKTKAKKKASTAKKKTAPKRKAAAKKSSLSANRKAAIAKRKALANRLRADLKASKDTITAVTEAAKAEIAVLKDQLNAAQKREVELRKLGGKKVRAMVAAGEKWEKRQMTKIHKITSKTQAKKKTRKK
jgi:hypothetical protein